MSHSDTVPLHRSSQSDIDEIENLINASVQSGLAIVLPARPPKPPRPVTIPVSSWPFIQSNFPPPPPSSNQKVPSASSGCSGSNIAAMGSRPEYADGACVDHGEERSVSNCEQYEACCVPESVQEDHGKAMRDWDLWGPLFFIVFLGLILSWSTSVKKSEVFAAAFALLAAGAVILTLNVLLLDIVIVKIVVVCVTLAWSSWAAYPFMSSAVNPRRKALALYPVFLMQGSN